MKFFILHLKSLKSYSYYVYLNNNRTVFFSRIYKLKFFIFLKFIFNSNLISLKYFLGILYLVKYLLRFFVFFFAWENRIYLLKKHRTAGMCILVFFNFCNPRCVEGASPHQWDCYISLTAAVSFQCYWRVWCNLEFTRWLRDTYWTQDILYRTDGHFFIPANLRPLLLL